MSTTLEKALQLVELVSDGDLSLQQLCQASGFSRSTTHRLAASLVKHRYLENKAQRYSLGYRFLELGEKKKSSLQFTKAAKPIAQNYCERTGETVHIAVLDGIYSMVVDRIIGSRQLQVNAYVGQRTLAYRTGAGKAMIASQPEREWLFFLNGIGRKERTRQLVEFAEIKEMGLRPRPGGERKRRRLCGDRHLRPVRAGGGGGELQRGHHRPNAGATGGVGADHQGLREGDREGYGSLGRLRVWKQSLAASTGLHRAEPPGDALIAP